MSSNLHNDDPILDRLLSIEALCYGVSHSYVNDDFTKRKLFQQFSPSQIDAIYKYVSIDKVTEKPSGISLLMFKSLHDFKKMNDESTIDDRSNMCLLFEGLLNSHRGDYFDHITIVYALILAVMNLVNNKNTTPSQDDFEDVELKLQLDQVSAKLKSLVSVHEGAIESKNRTIAELKQEVSVLVDDNATKLGEINNMKIELNEIMRQNNLYRTQKEKYQINESETLQLQNEIITLKKDIQSINEKYTKLTDDYLKLENENKNLNDSIKSLEMENSSVNNNMKVLQEDKLKNDELYKSRIIQLENEIEQLKNSNKSLLANSNNNENNKSLHSSDKQIGSEIDQKNAEDKSTSQNNQKLEIALAQLNKLREVVVSLKDLKAQDDLEHHNVKNQLHTTQSELSMAMSKIESLQGQVNLLMESSATTNSENDKSKLSDGFQELSISPSESFPHCDLFVHPTDTIPTYLIEVGSFTTRVGVWNATSSSFDLRFCYPSVVARSKAQSTQSILSIVRGASNMASPMFEKFRTSEIFVANDAWHVAFDHPDAGLRGGLELTFPIGLDGVISDKSGFDHILKHVLDHVIQSNTTKVKPRRTQIILSYKLTYEENDFKRMSEIMFDKYNFSTVCFMSEPSLSVIPSCNNSALILNVGPRVTSAVPIYENIAMRKCSVISNVGGEHVTEFLELLIDGQGVEAYSSLLNRRRRQFARLIKERHVFIASSFPDAKRQYGEFFFEFVKVLANTAEDSSSAIQNVDSSKTEHTKDIAIQESYTLGNGQQITISIDRELFYAGELLFSPVLHEPCENEKSIIEVLLASIDEIDESVREEICKQIIVTGKTSLLSGFEKRLRLELSSELAMRGIFDFEIIMSEEQNKTTSAVWSGADHWIRSVQTSAEGRNILSQEYYQKNGPSSVYQLD